MYDVEGLPPETSGPGQAMDWVVPRLKSRWTPLPVEKLKESMADFVKRIGDVIVGAESVPGQLELETVEVSVEISAEGTVGILGTGVGLTGTSGMTLTFKRKGATK